MIFILALPAVLGQQQFAFNAHGESVELPERSADGSEFGPVETMAVMRTGEAVAIVRQQHKSQSSFQCSSRSCSSLLRRRACALQRDER